MLQFVHHPLKGFKVSELDWVQLLYQAGDHPFNIPGPVGNIEGVLSVPNAPRESLIAIIGHPHSLQGGTMNNKVVTTLARLFTSLNIINLRFNFRGVGATAGVYDAGVGESEDMLFLVDELKRTKPEAHFIFSGFSFGSYVAYRAAGAASPHALISIAPPVHHYDYQAYSIDAPWFIVQGEADEVVPAQEVYAFIEQTKPKPLIISLKDTGHFFHGKLLDLKSLLLAALIQKGVV